MITRVTITLCTKKQSFPSRENIIWPIDSIYCLKLFGVKVVETQNWLNHTPLKNNLGLNKARNLKL